MKQQILWVLAAVALSVLASYTFLTLKTGTHEHHDAHESAPATKEHLHDGEKHEEESSKGHSEEHILISSMQRFQWFGNKLWFAGNAENWELAGFYTHELEEVAEEVIEAKITDDGANISDLMSKIAMPNIENLEKAVKSKDKNAFLEHYKMLINTCNSCHQTAGKPFIKIKTPEKPIADMQDF
jgi:hypothetical protein